MKNAFLNEYETKHALADFILKANRLSMDTKCVEFENAFANFQGRKSAVLFNSGGSANLALLQALKNLGKLKEGDQVAFSALTWSTNTMPIIQMGLVPVPLDCDPSTLNVMSGNLLERLEQAPEIKALFLTNVLGFLGDINEIKNICNERNIILLEDNCESLGTELPEGKAGNFSLGSTFSFFVAHHMSTIEGGMICTDDEDLAEMLKIVRANGWDRNLSSAQQFKWRKKFNIDSEFQAKYTFYDLGFNFRPTEITGFLGLYQLKFLKENILTRQSNYLRLEKIFIENPDLIHLNHKHINVLSTFAFPVVCNNSTIRTEYLSRFAGAGIEIRPMIAGNMQNQPFYKKYVKEQYDLPGTDFLHDCGFYCGNYPELTESDLEVISSCLYKY
ncbi:aminotransferase class I/II-fold pyridoxal phosphate-dependent enzyme [Mucilaginibacter corticis]|uniref:Aminotransferase class I/II-fold pyridoxal phosphate-dependent enzyme n=1 Tax=Mucilaginibacter corticis TaxID=2597670 RepID=A0A556MK99_9SPHI|nr:aminotransferase class I/II-fold pyridoxal phosphate-dependent enzyme [Mucilaginibacter corticis]TSJ40302.1 aminotransferase class I/II-fold pyridoxal phosphate-dependent enzyme [Mucilaginibacter corticis]